MQYQNVLCFQVSLRLNLGMSHAATGTIAEQRKHKIKHNFIHLLGRAGGTTDSSVITGHVAASVSCMFLAPIVTA